MFIDKTLVARASSNVLSSLTNEMIEFEAFKGSLKELSKDPVYLEPQYTPPHLWINNKVHNDTYYYNLYPNQSKQITLNCWISPEHKVDWNLAERFIKILKEISQRIIFNVIGNSESINFQFTLSEQDLELFNIAFKSSYINCEITQTSEGDYNNNIIFFDYYPIVPYHNLLTRVYELTYSPYEALLYALFNLDCKFSGFCQIIFEPAKNNWHQNVEILTDLEYISHTSNAFNNTRSFGNQTPSIDMHTMAQEVVAKAHNDKPFFFASIRLGLVSELNHNNLSGLTSFINLFQMGGQSLKYLSQKEYSFSKTNEDITEMFRKGLCYHSGFLVNSYELAGLVHIPTIKEFSEREFPLCYLESRSLYTSSLKKTSGIVIGSTHFAGSREDVRIDDLIRKTSTHLIGRSGSGKSTAMENMILQDIYNYSGLAFLDPHGDSIKRLLKLIPKERIDSTIYIDFGNKKMIPVWNPLAHDKNEDVGKLTDDLVSSVKSIIKGNAWGDRLEHLLRNGFFGLLHLSDSTLYDLIVLFEYAKIPSKEKKELVDKISSLVNNPVAQRFWSRDLASYGKDDFRPPHHKLSKFLNSEESVSLMLTQSDNYLNLKNLINTDSILLFDLSSIGPESKRILGSYLFSLLHNYSLSRSNLNINERSSFNIYCDEAHKLTTDSLEDMIIETRKFGVNLTLAHQYLNQFNDSQRDALLSMGTTIIFNVDLRDAKILTKDLQNKVQVNDIATLKTGEAIARIGTKIVKLKTVPPTGIPKFNFEKEIKKQSFEKYYLTIDEIKKRIQERIKGFRFNQNKENDILLLDDNKFLNEYEKFK